MFYASSAQKFTEQMHLNKMDFIIYLMHFHSYCISVKFRIHSICHLQCWDQKQADVQLYKRRALQSQQLRSETGGGLNPGVWELLLCARHVSAFKTCHGYVQYNGLPSCFLFKSCSMCQLQTCTNMRKHTPSHHDLGIFVVYGLGV